jgi:hypothetical protein
MEQEILLRRLIAIAINRGDFNLRPLPFLIFLVVP